MAVLIKTMNELPSCCAKCPFFFEHYYSNTRYLDIGCSLDAFEINDIKPSEINDKCNLLYKERNIKCPLEVV